MQYGTPGDVYRSQVFPARLAPLPLLKRGDRAVIAVRVWLCRDDYVSHLGGGISMPPELGTRIPMQRAFDLQSKERQRSNLAFLLTAMPCTFLALVFIVCYRRQPQHAEYAWYAGMLLGRALFDFMWYGIFALGAYHGVGLLAGIAYPVNLGCSYFFFRGYFRVPGPRWFLWVLAACLLLQVPDGGGWVDWVTSAESNTLLGAGQLPVIAANVWLLIQQGRKKNSEAWVLGVPYLIYISGFVGRITMFLFRFNGIFGYDDFLANGLLLLEEPIAIPMELAGLMLGSLAMAGILLNRFTRIALRGERLNKELEAARQVQELLLPAASIEVPGFAVESAYWPASEVGGDFYQVLPCKEGGMIVVAGDVSGKGLKAA